MFFVCLRSGPVWSLDWSTHCGTPCEQPQEVSHLDNNSRVYELLITFTAQIIFLFLYGSPDLVQQKPEIVNLFKIIESLSAHYFQHLTGNAEQ